eukprot:1921986-Rhodomonas_salina.1
MPWYRDPGYPMSTALYLAILGPGPCCSGTQRLGQLETQGPGPARPENGKLCRKIDATGSEKIANFVIITSTGTLTTVATSWYGY